MAFREKLRRPKDMRDEYARIDEVCDICTESPGCRINPLKCPIVRNSGVI